MRKIKKLLNSMRFLILVPFLDMQDRAINMDIERWKNVLNLNGSNKQVLKELLSNHKEFRNLYIYRNTERVHFNRLVRLLYSPLESLYILSNEIGGGLYIQHGFSSYIAADTIGENCWINQQVTIGYNGKGVAPKIGNNVMIFCGAKVLGDITIGDNAQIGANAVVTKDVEPGAVMGGVPARRIR